MEGQEPEDRGSEEALSLAVPQSQPEEQMQAWLRDCVSSGMRPPELGQRLVV